MVAIKLYQPEEIVLNYFKTWGYTSPEVLSQMAAHFLMEHKDFLSMDEILISLNKIAATVAEQVMGKPTLPIEQQVAYFKMVFLSESLAGKCSLFMPLTQKAVDEMKKVYAFHTMQTSPSLVKSVMVPQKIKVYKPLLPLKKALLDLGRKVKKYVTK